MIPDLSRRSAHLAVCLAALQRELDWDALGSLYCHVGGEHFFPREQRAAVLDAGLAFAADLGELLRPGGASHYLGAAVAELAPILFEALVLERRVHWTLLPGPEARELQRALEMTGADLPVPLPPAPPPTPVDHLWCVSVLTDPDVFPALHDVLYGRRGGVLATGRGDEREERPRAEALVAQALSSLAPPALLSTTDEETPWFEAACAARGWRLILPERGRLSGIVGDVVRHARIEARQS